ncbi:MAG: MBL fold metallo-hydrolase [Candidatus Thermoplasmatota archaeon]|nr:MBL fold metallo-hydrolase [Candidatus Thermoplasmatota archaeon]
MRDIPGGDVINCCRITIVYDSEGLPGFKTGWGFSALVQMNDVSILFDCGWDGNILRHNLDRLGIRFADIDKIVLSHSHWDHISGLAEALSDPGSRTTEVVAPSSFSKNLKAEIEKRAELRVIDGPEEIAPGVMSTGILGGDVKEQSLVIVCGEKGVLVTGCAHPGVRNIVSRAAQMAKPSWLIGGLHDARAADMPESLDRVVLCHCTQNKDSALERFGDRASIAKVGETFVPQF